MNATLAAEGWLCFRNRALSHLVRRHLVNALVVLLIAPLANAAPRQQAPVPRSSQQSAAPAQSAPPAPQPTTPAQQPAKSQQTQQTQPLPSSPTPVGTAAAPYENPVGAAVSRPAGAAIAPAKQKRRRSFLIRTGLIIGAAIAVGTVVALSKASPSRPNQ
ncbi:MAG: hypothetical protein WBD10_14165 [Acidobacteriaceae bacterium]